MPLINTSVPNLIQGVSQQPDATRFDGQCEEQENALSSVAEGLKKRPNTRHVARLLDAAIDENSFVHFINRSNSEKYVVIHDGTKIQAWNILTGNEASINGATGGYTPASGSYLESNSPSTDLKSLTVADTTFMLNTRKGVALDTNHTDELAKEALVVINQGDYKKKYQVNVTINPLGSSTYSQATATVNLERYVYSTSSYYNSSTSWFSGGKHTMYTTHYRWRITGVTVTNDGEGYLNANVSFSSNKATYSNANYTAVIDGTDGSISSVDLNGSRGDYEGTGTYYPDNSGSTRSYHIGPNAPAISVSILPIASISSGQSISTSSFIWSGTSESSNNQGANTDSIASWLSSSSSSSGFNIDSDRQMNVADGSGHSIATYFDIDLKGSIIKLTKKDAWEGDFNISTEDSLADDGMTSIYKEVSSITDLPAKCFNGFKVKVIGDTELNQDDYYVEFQTSDGGSVGNGSWIETVGFDIEKGFDSSTMPFSLINDNTNSFVISEINFAERTAGDNTSNPNPSFVGREITNMFFFKNRLGFLSGDNVIFSEAGLGGEDENNVFAYNFYRNTVSSLLDSAPIDISVSSRRVTILESAVGFQDNLVLFSRTGQFVLKGADVLTPKTVSITPATNFDYDEAVPPLPLGSYIYYPFKRGSFTGLREFTVNSSTDTYDSAEVTEHVPAYIPSNITQMKGTTSEDIIALVSGNEPDTIYIYNYFWNNNQKVLSAWSKFTFTGEIRGIEFIESTLYAIITNNGQTHLVEMPLESGLSDAAGYVTHLDMRVAHKVHMRNFRFTGATGVAAHLNNINYSYDFEINGAQGYHSVPPSPEDSQILRGADGKWYLYELGGATYAMSTAGYTQYPWDADWTGTALANATFSFNGAINTINLPYTPEDNSVEVYTTDGLALNCTNSGSRVTLNNPLSADTDVWVGIPYTMKYTFSEQLFKAKAGNGKSPSNAAKMRIRNGSLYYADSAYFKVKVTPKYRDTYTNIFTPDVVGSSTIGSLTLGSGFYRFPVFTKPLDTTITIENESALPSTFQSAEFESFVHTRSNRYG